MIFESKPEHEAMYQDLAQLLRRHASGVSAIEMLAITSQIVGKVLAMQDQMTTTPANAMDVVRRNIEAGNRQAVEALTQPAGHG